MRYVLRELCQRLWHGGWDRHGGDDLPNGALHFERLDGGAQEPAPDQTTITARPNGPLFVRGQLHIVGVGGRLIHEETRAALCRCGHSENKPFCDGSHQRVGFRAT